VLVWGILSLLQRKFPIRLTELNRAVLYLPRPGVVALDFRSRRDCDRLGVLYLGAVLAIVLVGSGAVLAERAERLQLLLGLMVATGGVVALGGIIEFVLNISLVAFCGNVAKARLLRCICLRDATAPGLLCF
jgi:hypothetical protein